MKPKQHTYTVVGRITQVESPSKITMEVHTVNGSGDMKIPGGHVNLLLTDEASRNHVERTARVIAMGEKPTLLYRAIISDLPESEEELLFSSIAPFGCIPSFKIPDRNAA